MSAERPHDAPLDAWLDRHNAACLWSTRVGDDKRHALVIECWRIGAGIVIVSRYPRGGWGIATQANTCDVATTLRDAERRIGLRCDPLVLSPRFVVDVRYASGLLPERADVLLRTDADNGTHRDDHSLTLDDAETLGLALLDASDKGRRP